MRFSPEVIAFGGGVMDEFGDEIMATACESAKVKLGCELSDRTLLVASALGDLAGITGAAIWALRDHRQAQPETSSVALDPVH
jgi:predicted NBD/HSP70 family sugar kinase